MACIFSNKGDERCLGCNRGGPTDGQRHFFDCPWTAYRAVPGSKRFDYMLHSRVELLQSNSQFLTHLISMISSSCLGYKATIIITSYLPQSYRPIYQTTGEGTTTDFTIRPTATNPATNVSAGHLLDPAGLLKNANYRHMQQVNGRVASSRKLQLQ